MKLVGTLAYNNNSSTVSELQWKFNNNFIIINNYSALTTVHASFPLQWTEVIWRLLFWKRPKRIHPAGPSGQEKRAHPGGSPSPPLSLSLSPSPSLSLLLSVSLRLSRLRVSFWISWVLSELWGSRWNFRSSFSDVSPRCCCCCCCQSEEEEAFDLKNEKPPF